MTTRAQIKAKVLRLINKSAGYSGFHTDDHINDAIQDCVDWIVAQSHMCGEGWFKSVTTFAMPAGNTVALPTGVVIIDDVRYRQGDVFISIPYNDGENIPQQHTTGTVTQFPAYWRLHGRNIYFNPAPAEFGADFIQVEGFSYPADLTLDASVLDSQLDRAMENYIKWRAAAQLMTLAGRSNPDWEKYEQEWAYQVQQILSKRIRQTAYIKEFEA
jgi:hypothetical protein